MIDGDLDVLVTACRAFLEEELDLDGETPASDGLDDLEGLLAHFAADARAHLEARLRTHRRHVLG